MSGFTNQRSYIHRESIPLEVGVQVILANVDMPEKKERALVGSYEVHVTSLRLRTFALKGTKCYICGLEATHFSIDNFSTKSKLEHPHMNLWGVTADGEGMLFTHDHIMSRGRGGKDNLKNTITCCSKCNTSKAVVENAITAGRCSPPAWIIIDDGHVFEGTQAHWANCFFSNATRKEIKRSFNEMDMLKNRKCEIRDMTDEEILKWPDAVLFHKWLLETYGEA